MRHIETIYKASKLFSCRAPNTILKQHIESIREEKTFQIQTL